MKLSPYQCCLAVFLLLSLTSCLELGSNTLAEFDKTINRLENESANWRKVVKDLENSTKETISHELEDFARTTINTAGVQFRCNTAFLDDYVGYEVQKKLLQKRNELASQLGKSTRSIPDPSPVICGSSTDKIEVKGQIPQTNSVEFYGYYLNPNAVQIQGVLAQAENSQDPNSPQLINQQLAGGQFMVALNLGDNGVTGETLKRFDRLILSNKSQEIHSINIIHIRPDPTKANVTVNLKSIYIEDDADPAGSAEVNFTFRVNQQEQSWRNNNANTGKTYPLNKQFQLTLSKGERLNIYAHGVDEDGGWIDEDDPLGVATQTFVDSQNWGLGSHNIRSNCPDGCYTLSFDVVVDWIEE